MNHPELSKLAEALDIAARQHNQSAAACREAAAIIGGMAPKECAITAGVAIARNLRDSMSAAERVELLTDLGGLRVLALDAAAEALGIHPFATSPDPIEAAVDAYLEDYEFGDSGYQPTPVERAIAKDAIMGLLADDGFLQAVDSLPDDAPAREVNMPEAEAKFAQWWSANYSGMFVSLDGNYHAGRVLRAVLRSMGLPS